MMFRGPSRQSVGMVRGSKRTLVVTADPYRKVAPLSCFSAAEGYSASAIPRVRQAETDHRSHLPALWQARRLKTPGGIGW